MFPVFDPVNENFLYFKPRERVHTDGDWHRGVQANIIRRNATNSFDILVQERSAKVDIGTRKFDQSLATQMLDIDGFNEKRTLRRGLLSELGIRNYRATKVKRDLRIVKTYREHPDALNRELISLYLVEPNEGRVAEAMTPKIERIFWMAWDSFLEFFRSNQSHFTKTGQFYFSHSELLMQIEQQSRSFLSLPAHTAATSVSSHHPLVHIDRWPSTPRTYRGDITRSLARAGELETQVV